MRIWIVNHYAVPLGRKGGSRHATLAKHLSALGHEVTVFAASVAHGTNEDLVAAELFTQTGYADQWRDNVRWRFLRSRTHRSTAERFMLMRDFGVRVQRSLDGLPAPDIVIGSCVHPFAVEAARRISKRTGAEFVYEIRDIWPESLVDLGAMSRWHPAYLLFRRIELRAFRDAAGVVTLFPGMQPYVTDHGVAPSRICYTPNGVDVNSFPSLPPPPDSRGFRFLYFGSHGPANDLGNVLTAAKLVGDSCDDPISIHLIGTGPEKQTLERRAASLGLTNLHFRDAVGKAELREEAKNADAFLYSHSPLAVVAKYGLSANKLFEYLAFGRPIVFSCTSYNDPVADAGAGLSAPAGNPEDLAAAMITLARTSLQERSAMAARGREYALEHHDLRVLAERLEAFLVSVASRDCRRGQRLAS